MDNFRKELNTRRGQLIAGTLDVLLVYILASVAIDTANMFVYAATIFFVFSTGLHFVNVYKLSRPVPKRAHAKR